MDIKRLKEQRAKVWEQVKEAEARLSADGIDFSADTVGEDIQTRDKAVEAVTRLSQLIESAEEERASGIAARMDSDVPDTEVEVRRTAEQDPELEYKSAWLDYIRRGDNRLSPEVRSLLEARGTLVQQTDNLGDGYLIPPSTLQRMTEAMKAFGGILQHAEILNTATGNAVNWPTSDETAAEGQIIAEGDQVTVADITFGQFTLGAYTYSSNLVKLSYQLMQDNEFDLEGFVARKLGERLGRITAKHLAIGTGSGEPQGLFRASAVTVGKTGATGQTTTVKYDDIVDLIHSIDPAYRDTGSRFVTNDATIAYIRKIRDDSGGAGLGRPIWEPSIQEGVPDSILAYPVTIDQNVPTMAANALSLGFGNVSDAYVVRQVSGGRLVRLNELYADRLQVGFYSFLRLDAKVQHSSGPFKTYKNSAT